MSTRVSRTSIEVLARNSPPSARVSRAHVEVLELGTPPNTRVSRVHQDVLVGWPHPYNSAVLVDGPWGAWEATSTGFSDFGDGAHAMTTYGGPTTGIVGPYEDGMAIGFGDSTVSDQYASTVAAEDSRSSSATVEVWFYLAALPNASTPLISQGTAHKTGNNADKILSIGTDGRLNWATFTTAWEKITSTDPVALNTWHHVVASVGSASTKIRLNKVTVATGSRTTSSTSGSPTALIVHGGTEGSAQGLLTQGGPVTISRVIYYKSQLSDTRTDVHFDSFPRMISRPLGMAEEFDSTTVMTWTKLQVEQAEEADQAWDITPIKGLGQPLEVDVASDIKPFRPSWVQQISAMNPWALWLLVPEANYDSGPRGNNNQVITSGGASRSASFTVGGEGDPNPWTYAQAAGFGGFVMTPSDSFTATEAAVNIQVAWNSGNSSGGATPQQNCPLVVFGANGGALTGSNPNPIANDKALYLDTNRCLNWKVDDVTITAPSPIPEYSFVTVAATVGSNGMQLFVDGRMVAEDKTKTSCAGHAQSVWLNRANPFNAPFNGAEGVKGSVLCAPTFWDRTLTPVEVRKVYRAMRPGFAQLLRATGGGGNTSWYLRFQNPAGDTTATRTAFSLLGAGESTIGNGVVGDVQYNQPGLLTDEFSRAARFNGGYLHIASSPLGNSWGGTDLAVHAVIKPEVVTGSRTIVAAGDRPAPSWSGPTDRQMAFSVAIENGKLRYRSEGNNLAVFDHPTTLVAGQQYVIDVRTTNVSQTHYVELWVNGVRAQSGFWDNSFPTYNIITNGQDFQYDLTVGAFRTNENPFLGVMDDLFISADRDKLSDQSVADLFASVSPPVEAMLLAPSESDSATTMNVDTIKIPLGQAFETDESTALGKVSTLDMVQAEEVDSAQSIQGVTYLGLPTALEFDSSDTMTKGYSLNTAEETDLSTPMALGPVFIPIGQATTDVSADSLTTGFSLRMAEEVDAANPISRPPIFVNLGMAFETDSTLNVNPGKTFALTVYAGGAAEVEDDEITTTPTFRLEVADHSLYRAPTSAGIVVAGGVPNAVIDFYIDGTLVYSYVTDSDGGVGLTSLAIEPPVGSSIGTHTIEARQTALGGVIISASDTYYLTRQPPKYPQNMNVDADPLIVPGAISHSTYHWVLQDLLPVQDGGIGSYVFPMNPKEMTSPHLEKALTSKHTTAKDGQFHIMEAGNLPKEWTFSGFCPTQEMREKIEEYAALTRRFWIIDHRNRAWKVLIQAAEFTPLLRKVFNDNEVDGHDYTVTAIVLDQNWKTPV